MSALAPDKLKLTAELCTSKGYRVIIQNGVFSRLPVPAGPTLKGSWGASGTAWAVGEGLQLVPEHLEPL